MSTPAFGVPSCSSDNDGNFSGADAVSSWHRIACRLLNYFDLVCNHFVDATAFFDFSPFCGLLY